MRNTHASGPAVKEAPEEYGAASLPDLSEAMRQTLREVFDEIERLFPETRPKRTAVVLQFPRPFQEPRAKNNLH
jgi:hypothetical protein